MTQVPTHNPADDLALARRVAAEAGVLLLAHRDEFGPVAPDDKERLTELRRTADARANELIMRQLRSHRPDDAVLSEEEADSAARLGAARTWIVDPLDGTWEYGQGRSDFGVHIALWNAPADGRPGQLGASVVELPAGDKQRTSGDDSAELPPIPVTGPLRMVVSRNRPPAELDNIVARWGSLLDREVVVVNVGSVGAKVEEILTGRAHAYLHNTGFYEWDVAAPAGVAHRYGLIAEHWDGSPLQFNMMPPKVRDLMVCRPELVDELRAVIREG